MGVQDRDWWREKYDELHGRKKQQRRVLPSQHEASGPSVDSKILKVATLAVLALVILLLCLRKAHIL